MKLQFNPEAKVTEWVNGPVRFKNEGGLVMQRVRSELKEPDARLAKQMLKQMHEVSPRQFVPVFVLAESQGRTTRKEANELSGEYPNDFPHVDLLTKNGLSYEEAKLLGKEDLTKLDGIGPKSADAILNFGKEQ